MTEVLKKLENTYVVTIQSPDDGHRVEVAYFSSLTAANDYAAKNSGVYATVLHANLWKGEDGECYKVSRERVLLDEDMLRQRALEKLTEREKKALGL